MGKKSFPVRSQDWMINIRAENLYFVRNTLNFAKIRSIKTMINWFLRLILSQKMFISLFNAFNISDVAQEIDRKIDMLFLQ